MRSIALSFRQPTQSIDWLNAFTWTVVIGIASLFAYLLVWVSLI